MLRKVTDFLSRTVSSIGYILSSTFDSIRDFVGFGKRFRTYSTPPEPRDDFEFDIREPEDEYDIDETEPYDDGIGIGIGDDEDIAIPDNLVIIRGEPTEEDDSSFRGTFFLLTDLIEYATDVPVQVRAYVIDDTYLVFISANSDDELIYDSGIYRMVRSVRWN